MMKHKKMRVGICLVAILLIGTRQGHKTFLTNASTSINASTSTNETTSADASISTDNISTSTDASISTNNISTSADAATSTDASTSTEVSASTDASAFADTSTSSNATTYKDDLDYYQTSTMQMATWENGGDFDCIFSPNNITFQDSIMNLSINESTDSTYEYSGAEYRTQSTYGYGTYTVRMKPIKNDGVVSSFFTYTGPANGTVWDEIDIEFAGKDTTHVQFNFYTNGFGGHEYIYKLPFDASEGFHTYSFTWAKNSITWYVDGVMAYRVTSSNATLPSTPGKIMMNVWPGRSSSTQKWLNVFDGKTPLTAQYDYFSYKPYLTSTATSTQTKSQVLPQSWITSKVANQYQLKVEDNQLRITRLQSQNQEKAYIVGKLQSKVTNPTKLTFDLNYTNGYKLAFTIAVVNTAGKETIISKRIYGDFQKGVRTVSIPIKKKTGTISKIKMYINSNPNQIDVAKNSYCRAFIGNVRLTK